MKDWYVGQKIVCIDDQLRANAKRNMLGVDFILKYLRVGKIYTINSISIVKYDTHTAEQVAFLLEGIDTNYSNNNWPSIDKFGERDYHFVSSRFRPLEDDVDKIDISLFQGLLDDVNSGKVRFDDDTFREDVVKRRVKENV